MSISYSIVPMTLVMLPESGQIKSAVCADDEAAEWYIHVTNEQTGERKVILHAMSREIADVVVELLEG
jgi:hypothetical protein